jgi:hypothetical protein
VSVRWHSLRRLGIKEAGRRAGRGNAWILVKIPVAYGSREEGDGIERG